MSQNEAVMSVHGGVSQESTWKKQDVGDVSIFSCIKLIFIVEQR